MDKLIGTIRICYLVVNVIWLEQDVMHYKANFINNETCHERLEQNNNAWKKVIIEDHIQEISKD